VAARYCDEPEAGGEIRTPNSKVRKRTPLRALAAALPDFIRLAKADTSGLVRLALASTLQRLPVSQRAGLAAALLARKTDANDHNLPLLIWMD